MIPADLTPLIGRRRELAQVRGLLEESRLLTLTGPGGIGKTRLALQLARTRARAFPGGVWSVSLGALADPGLLAAAVASAIGLPEPGAAPVEALVGHLADRRALLVLDDCEHLVEECALLVRALLGAAAGLRVLVTSRQALGVAGEQVFPVPPLSVPSESVVGETPETLVRYEAVALFLSRARAVEPGFRLDGAQLGPVARLCRDLEGVPLAIELAAIRLPALSVREIVARLDDRFRLLNRGNRGAPARQSSLAAVVEWSYQLLDEVDRRLWRRLTVFAGGMELDAAEAVCCDEELPVEALLDRLHRLVERSIVVRDDRDGRVRFCMLESLRQFGHARLVESGELDVVCARHRDWCVALAERAEAGWSGAEQLAWNRRLGAERHNLRRAVEYVLSVPGEAATGLRLVAALRHYWLVNAVAEGRRHGERLLAVLPADRSGDGARVAGLWLAGWLAFYQGDTAVGRRYAGQARELAAALGDPAGLAYGTYVLGLCAHADSAGPADLAEAVELLDAARQAQRRSGDLVGEWLATADLAGALGAAGRTDEGIALCGPVIEQAGRRGAAWCQAYLMWVLADLRRRSGDLPGAGRTVTGILRISRDFDDPSLIGSSLEFLAWVATGRGEPAEAAWLLGAARAAWGTPDVALLRYPDWRTAHDAALAAAGEALGQPGFDRAFHRGGQLTRAAAVDRALRGGTTSATAASDPVTPASAPPPGGESLTPRELQVAELISEGLTNKQIAHRLVIAQRTAEGHVERILRKLDAGSRATVAAWWRSRVSRL